MREDARTLLTREGIVPMGSFNPEIRASWQRCFDHGLDPFGHPEQIQISNADLNKRREENGLVRRLAKMEMENLHRQIAGSKFIIIFADHDGVILDRIVDGSTDTHNSGWTMPGFTWQEEVNGTNALGLVAAIRQPAIVHGGEHYFKAYGGLTCAASPIFGRNGKLVGIIDATSDCRSRQRHTLALVGMSCVTIENGLFRDRHKGNLIFELHNRSEFLGTLQSAMLAFDGDGFLEESNRQAKQLLPDLPPRARIHFDQIFRIPFRNFLDRLPGARSIYLTDTEGSSFAVRAFNYRARKLTEKPIPVPAFSRAPREIPMVSEDPAVRSAMHLVRRAVELNVPILIRGETGTGKELMARYAHAISNREGEFVAVNCAALPETLIESELFGHQDGSFTGATRGGWKGLVRQANRGTLFLDEIGTMPAQVQAKLLRFLDRMEIRPIGNAKEIQLDIQLISATNTVLKGMERTDEFRPDLLYRINTMEVCLPALRQRRDLRAIIGAIIETFQQPLELEPAALRLLEAYSWPGNIRELKGLLTRLLITCESGKASAEDVQKILAVTAVDTAAEPQPKNLADQELAIIQAAYERNSGNISAIARELGISRNTVYKKLKEARLTRPKF
ncbi:MAG: sigma-54-dependent Fis family transcriptional regulator [Desulfobacterales bacterium]|nr:MAG: sigma-54-dependent Fis family transcriptional regulator [Desulfobacterales bacterium]